LSVFIVSNIINYQDGVDSRMQEYVFTCSAIKRESGSLVTYFISREYDINPWIKHKDVQFNTTTHFVFASASNEKPEPIRVIAIAEEPPSLSLINITRNTNKLHEYHRRSEYSYKSGSPLHISS